MNREKKYWDLMGWIAFLSKFIELHFKKILVFFLLAVFFISFLMFVRYLETQGEQQSFDNLSEITKIYNDRKKGFERALEKKTQSLGKKADKFKNLKADKKDQSGEELSKTPSGDLSRDYGEVVVKLEAFIMENKGQKASVEAGLILSEIYLEYNMEEKAIQTLSMVLQSMEKKAEKDDLLFNLLNMRLGNLWMIMPEACSKALPYFKTVGDSKSFIASQAQLKQVFVFKKREISSRQKHGTKESERIFQSPLRL